MKFHLESTFTKDNYPIICLNQIFDKFWIRIKLVLNLINNYLDFIQILYFNIDVVEIKFFENL